jgi:hypothetical protein
MKSKKQESLLDRLIGAAMWGAILALLASQIRTDGWRAVPEVGLAVSVMLLIDTFVESKKEET